jgi:hypothetical protein
MEKKFIYYSVGGLMAVGTLIGAITFLTRNKES